MLDYREKLIILMRKNGYPFESIGKELGVSTRDAEDSYWKNHYKAITGVNLSHWKGHRSLDWLAEHGSERHVEIVARIMEGETLREIAKDFRCSYQNVHLIAGRYGVHGERTREKKELKCPVCGTVKTVLLSSPRKYCSKDCASVGRRKRSDTTRYCRTCLTVKDLLPKGNYCHSCHRKRISEYVASKLKK